VNGRHYTRTIDKTGHARPQRLASLSGRTNLPLRQRAAAAATLVGALELAREACVQPRQDEPFGPVKVHASSGGADSAAPRPDQPPQGRVMPTQCGQRRSCSRSHWIGRAANALDPGNRGRHLAWLACSVAGASVPRHTRW
jgi:hypothetical protein